MTKYDRVSGDATQQQADPDHILVELSGIEPLTSSLRTRRSPN